MDAVSPFVALLTGFVRGVEGEDCAPGPPPKIGFELEVEGVVLVFAGETAGVRDLIAGTGLGADTDEGFAVDAVFGVEAEVVLETARRPIDAGGVAVTFGLGTAGTEEVEAEEASRRAEEGDRKEEVVGVFCVTVDTVDVDESLRSLSGVKVAFGDAA